MVQDKVHFQPGGAFATELKQRVNAYFEQTGLSTRDAPAMYRKTAFIAVWLVASYLSLMFLAHTWWQIVPLAISAGLAQAAVGFNVQHDGGHGAYSRFNAVNTAMAHALDFVGGSSYVWHWKHDVIHHTWANVAHVDADTDVGPFARLTPHHAHHGFHRFQHLYIWVLYAMLPFKWIFFDDFKDLATGTIGTQKFPRPTPARLASILGMKAFYFTWAIAIPFATRPWQGVLLAYAVSASVLGVTLAVVFQLAHCVAEADFPPAQTTMDTDWQVHNVLTTVDFARESKLLAWYLGGLNFQVEHHLFPKISHVHFPALAPIVEQTCKAHGIRYRAHPTLGAGIAAHARWLRHLGGSAVPAPNELQVAA